MLNPAGHDDKFAFFHPLVGTVFKLHPEASFDDQKEFILLVMVVEDKFTLDLVELHHLPVEFGGNVRLPHLSDIRELLGNVDFHAGSDYSKWKKVARKSGTSPRRLSSGLSETHEEVPPALTTANWGRPRGPHIYQKAAGLRQRPLIF